MRLILEFSSKVSLDEKGFRPFCTKACYGNRVYPSGIELSSSLHVFLFLNKIEYITT